VVSVLALILIKLLIVDKSNGFEKALVILGKKQ